MLIADDVLLNKAAADDFLEFTRALLGDDDTAGGERRE
jgi:hypothetical protein